MFVFDRLQVVGDKMNGWDDPNPLPFNGSASASKKRRFETSPLGHPAFKRHEATFDNEDIEL